MGWTISSRAPGDLPAAVLMEFAMLGRLLFTIGRKNLTFGAFEFFEVINP